MESGSNVPLSMNPEALGPLGDRPLAETAKGSSPDDLFPGAAAFFSQRQQAKSRQLLDAVTPRLRQVLKADERVLFATLGAQVPHLLQAMTLGYFARAYHRVMLIFTDTRIIEVLLDFHGKNPDSRLRSYPLTDSRDLNLRFSRLRLTPATGRKQVWTISMRGGRKLLKQLLPRLSERLLREGNAAAQPLPIWHCPECGSSSGERPKSCASCGTLFRSPRMAAWLSLAFPGAGLLYSGNPFLAAGDFLGEIIMFSIIFAGLLTAQDAPTVIAMAGMGLFFLAITKAESIHLGHIFTTRTRPESPVRRERFRKFGMAGGVLSVLAISAAFLMAGMLKEGIDRDLQVSVEDGVWSGSRSLSDWAFFGDDPAARSQWTHETGLVVTVFAYPLGGPAERQEFRETFTTNMEDAGPIVFLDENLPGRLQGFRHIQNVMSPAGESLVSFNYFVFDPEGQDVHQIFTAVSVAEAAAVGEMLDDLVGRTRWVDPIPPDQDEAPRAASIIP
ncbi:MAG: hypothetical protein O7A63_06070 [Acidobacteria bacterium]|nr:hypothetical protein [Acidobacteriota bacterium]